MSTTEYDAFYIGGKWQPAETSERQVVISPSTEEPVGSVPLASHADIDAAVAAARAALPAWRALSPQERADHLERLADAMTQREDELAELITSEQGGTHFAHKLFSSTNAQTNFRYHAEVARNYEFERIRISDLSGYAGSEGGSVLPMAGKSLLLKEPVGVVVVMPAYNIAVPAIAHKGGAALAAGCTIVVKVPEQDPLGSFAVAQIADEIGFPAGVLNLVAAGPEASNYLVGHPDVAMVTFTGSTAVGQQIAATSAALLRPAVLELGGKSAAIILDDADPDEVVPALVGATAGAYSGQVCHSPTRWLVSAARYDEYADRFAAAFESLKVGDPWDDDTVVGPLISEKHRDRVLGFIERAKAHGATVKTGGGRPEHLDRGWYVEPTVLTDVTNDMEVAQEEIFGPVAVMIKYEDESDAVRIANDSKFGLAGSVYTSDVTKAFDIARQIEAGTLCINGHSIDSASSHDGFKQSGLGRESGPESIAEFLQNKTISIDPAGELPAEIVKGRPLAGGPGTQPAV